MDERVLIAFYSKALGLFYPSDHEGFGLPVVEAMACGCPVVTTRSGALAESAGDAGLFVDPSDIDSLEQAMALLVDHQTAEPI